MFRTTAIGSVALLVLACHEAPSPRAPESTEPADTSDATGATKAADSLPECCTGDEIDRFAGKRVRLVGVYRAVVVSQRGDAKPDMSDPGAAGVESESGQVVMLGVHHRLDGVRTIEERRRYDGKRVEVIGVIERRTPTELSEDGQPSATMINPYLHSIDSIRAAE